MEQTRILSRNDALKQLSAWLHQLEFTDDLSVKVHKSVWDEGQRLSTLLAEQVLEDPRTEGFLQSQTSDLLGLLKEQKTPPEWSVGYMKHLHSVMLQGHLGDNEQRAREEFYSQRIAEVWNAELAHRTAVEFAKTVLREDDEFVLHFVAKMYVRACIQRLDATSAVLRALFWQSRMVRCARLGYFSPKPLSIVPSAQPGKSLSAILDLVSIQAWNRLGVPREQADQFHWQPVKTGWVAREVLFPADSFFSSKWFSQEMCFWHEHGQFYGFKHPALPTSFRGVHLSHQGSLSHLFDVQAEVSSSSKNFSEGLILRKEVTNEVSVCIDNLPPHVETALQHHYEQILDIVSQEKKTLSLEEWVKKNHQRVAVLLVLRRVSQPLAQWIDNSAHALSTQQRASFWGHQLTLLQRTLKAHSES